MNIIFKFQLHAMYSGKEQNDGFYFIFKLFICWGCADNSPRANYCRHHLTKLLHRYKLSVSPEVGHIKRNIVLRITRLKFQICIIWFQFCLVFEVPSFYFGKKINSSLIKYSYLELFYEKYWGISYALFAATFFQQRIRMKNKKYDATVKNY